MRNLYLVTVPLVMLFASCQRTICESETTGWDYNDPKNGGFQKVPFAEQETGPGLILIEGGTFDFYLDQDSELISEVVKTEVRSFYLDESEVSNGDWLQYMEWTNKVFDDEYMYLKLKLLPDTNVWHGQVDEAGFYSANYLRHPSYANYPVVGVSWVQASDYCLWRTDRVNEYILIREEIIKGDYEKGGEPFTTQGYFSGQYDESDEKLLDLDPSNGGFDPMTGRFKSKDMATRIVRMEDGILLPRYRLPTELEWEYVANSKTSSQKVCKDLPFRKYNQKVAKVPFLLEQEISNEYFLDPATFPLAPIYSGCPNDYGIYNMAGNVSEWVDQQDIERNRNNLSFIFTNRKEVDYNISLIYTDFFGFKGKMNLSYADTIAADMIHMMMEELEAIVVLNRDKKFEEAQENIKYFIEFTYEDVIARSWDYYDTSWQQKIDPFMQDFTDNITRYEIPSSVQYYYSDARYNKWYFDSIQGLGLSDSYIFKGMNWSDDHLIPSSYRRKMDKDSASALVGFRCAMDRFGSPYGLGKKRRY